MGKDSDFTIIIIYLPLLVAASVCASIVIIIFYILIVRRSLESDYNACGNSINSAAAFLR